MLVHFLRLDPDPSWERSLIRICIEKISPIRICKNECESTFHSSAKFSPIYALTFKFESFNLWLALPWRRSTSWILSTSAWSRSPPSLTSTGPSSGTTALSTLPSKKLVDFHFTPFLHLIVLGGYLDEVFFISFVDPDPAKDERADLIKTWFIILVLWILYYCRTVLKNRKWQIPVVGRFFFLI